MLDNYHTMKLLGFAPKDPIPDDIKVLANFYKLGVEYFICPRHHQWYIEFDVNFPYMSQWCRCNLCKISLSSTTEIDIVLGEIKFLNKKLSKLLNG